MDLAIFTSNSNEEAESYTICKSLPYGLTNKISMDISRIFPLNN